MKELDKGITGFERWLNQKNIQNGIKSFEIVDFWQDPKSIDPAFYFHVKINGKNAYILVIHNGGMEWAKKQEKPAGG